MQVLLVVRPLLEDQTMNTLPDANNSMTEQTAVDPLDFNADVAPSPADRDSEREAIKSALITRLESVRKRVYK